MDGNAGESFCAAGIEEEEPSDPTDSSHDTPARENVERVLKRNQAGEAAVYAELDPLHLTNPTRVFAYHMQLSEEASESYTWD